MFKHFWNIFFQLRVLIWQLIIFAEIGELFYFKLMIHALIFITIF